MPVLIEAMVTSAEQAMLAEEAGAGRIELCGPGDGGLTPGIETLESTLRAVRVPVHVMVRPRSGDFRYSAGEFDAMRQAIAFVKGAGAGGVVLGVLLADRTLDVPRMQQLVALARPLRVVCHRAFDRTPDADAALDELIALGVDAVLTGGHATRALDGTAVLQRLVGRAAGRIGIIAGGRVRGDHVRALVDRTGVREVHADGSDAATIAGLAAALRDELR